MTMMLGPGLLESPTGGVDISPWVFNGVAMTQEAEGASSGASINMPSHSTGDLLVLYGSAQPGKPTGWTQITTGNVDCHYKVAASGSEAPVTAGGTPGDEGRFIHVLSFTHSLGKTPTYVTWWGQQRLGQTEFIIPRLLATGSYSDVLNVSGASKSGASSVTTPVFVDVRKRTTQGDTWYESRVPDFGQWTPSRFTYLGSAYSISASSATPATEWRYWFSPFDGAPSGNASTGASVMFRGV